jgi:hypothetical protein
MNLNRRIAALERELAVSEPATLTMPDGRVVTLTGGGKHIVRLLGVVFEGSTPAQAAQLDSIRESTGSKEPGGGHLVDLIRSLLLSPVEEGL